MNNAATAAAITLSVWSVVITSVILLGQERTERLLRRFTTTRVGAWHLSVFNWILSGIRKISGQHR